MAEYIDKEEVLKRLNDFNEWCKDGRFQGVLFAVDVIKDIPTTEVQPVNCKNPFELIKAACTSTTWCIDCKYGSICPMKDKNCVKPCNW